MEREYQGLRVKEDKRGGKERGEMGGMEGGVRRGIYEFEGK